MGRADADAEWWRTAVIYQIYPRSFADANGDGIGDLVGIAQRLDSLVSLGIDAVWLSPFYPSPQRDAGYDVADYCGVDPIFGTLADFDELLASAHRLGLRVIIDLVAQPTPPPPIPGSPRRWPRRPTRRRASAISSGTSQRTGSPCSAEAPGPGCPTGSGTCTCTTRLSPISTGAPPTCARSSSTCFASGSTAGSTAFASMSPTG